MTIEEVLKTMTDEEKRAWLAEEIKKNLNNKNWDLHEYLSRIHSRLVYGVK